ncbi:hypothetical protein [Pseudoalteromonas sp. MMG007]|uniref:hypothetical protein n=1 Tax=Pseudoalteromonas sp. MMG007 TaxID=2822684 RepID=UPI001B37D90C|nr:hypothetical protein [Pseudoalteromonas sp. MMG007]MBQ4859993.1 hypothetical protein [Pseudoalteromonas sp. MMG007]
MEVYDLKDYAINIDVLFDLDYLKEGKCLLSTNDSNLVVDSTVGLLIIDFINYLNFPQKSHLTNDELILAKSVVKKISECEPTNKSISASKLSFQFINSCIANKLSDKFNFLLDNIVFKALLSVFIISSICWYNSTNGFPTYEYLAFPSWLSIFSMYLISVLFHEFGHAAACKKYSGRCGAIGIAFYYAIPVFFADVSRSWKVNKRKRLIISLAGVYFQFLFLTIIFLLSSVFNSYELYVTSLMIAISIIFALNPLVKFDGYWALLDLCGKKSFKSYFLHVIELNDKSFKDLIFVLSVILISTLYYCLTLTLAYNIFISILSITYSYNFSLYEDGVYWFILTFKVFIFIFLIINAIKTPVKFISYLKYLKGILCHQKQLKLNP